MKHHSKKRGFTLIELLVVIAIVSLLSSVILASLSSAQARGRDANRLTELRQIKYALELYYDQYGYYPPDLNGNTAIETSNGDLSATSGCGTDSNWSSSGGLAQLTPQYIAALPKDPLNRSGYCLRYEPSGANASRPQNACLWVSLENGSTDAERVVGTTVGTPYALASWGNTGGYECSIGRTIFTDVNITSSYY